MLPPGTRFFSLILVFFAGLTNPSSGQTTLAEWNFPNNPDNATVDIAVPMNAAATIVTQGGTGTVAFANGGATTRSAHCTNWDNGNGLKHWEITISTTGYSGIWISSKQRSSSTGPRDFKMQYRIGAGVWNDVPGATAITLANNWVSGVITGLLLPAACDNQASVSIRWIMTSNTAVDGSPVGTSGVSNMDDLNISFAPDHYYRSVMNGNWNVNATWESSPDNVTWNPASLPPSYLSRTVTVRATHTVTVNSNIRIDETIVENGGAINWSSAIITIANGPAVDLQVDGTFTDDSPSNIMFSTGGTWSLGISGTYIKSSGGSANNWRDNYNSGIVNIPSTANWIVRKTGVPNPSVSSVQMYYPNLTFENFTGGNWVAFGSSGFQGSSTNTTIKGNLDIGGSGTGTVELENIMVNVNPTVVLGTITVRSGNTLRNYGTGFEVYGDLVCNGTILYDANDPRRWVFTGSGAQFISGTGTLNVYNMIMNKSLNDLTLNRTVKVDNNITFNNPGGRIFSSLANLLILESAATATNANNSSFVHGPVRKLGTAAFTFPVGKNNDYQAIAMGAGVSGGGSVFWTEDFGSGCNSGQLATSYTGVNGTWSISNTGLNEATANTWYVSAAENGNGAGNCGSACGSNRTLHLGSTLPVDPGAAYLETDPFTCSFLGICSATDKRAESPVINCSGQTGITLSLHYMEAGDGINDNALLYYYDGTAWALLADLPKTLCCGGVACNGSLQGLWSAYSIALPASANNNPNVRIGFRWMNNADGIATDPSFAVDNITLSNTAAVETFTAEYFHNDPQTDFNNVVNPFIDHISQCEYWILTRDAGTSTRTVTLTWDANSCGVTNLGDLTTARFNGGSWDDRGNGGTTGSVAAGTITTGAAQTSYGPFTLASTTNENPLPVELIRFDAHYKNRVVWVEWTTATELNSDYFKVMRSADGVHYKEIGRHKAAGHSQNAIHYRHIDHEPLSGISYYRLDQTDFDGTENISKPVAVRLNEEPGTLSIISATSFPSSGSIDLNIYAPGNAKISLLLFDGTGKLVYSGSRQIAEGLNNIRLQNIIPSTGIYTVRVYNDFSAASARFMY